MTTKRQYLLVDTKRYRRHSAPENLGEWFEPQYRRQIAQQRENSSRASVCDFSVLLENQSESNSSQELDTSNLSRDLSPVPTTKTSPRDSYQNFPVIDFGTPRKSNQDDHWHGFGSRSIWKNIVLSQAIAGCMAIMDVSNAGLKNSSRNVVTSGQNLPHYICLGVLWTTKLALRNDGRDIIQVLKFSGLRYFFLTVLHVEANYLLLSSLQHNTYMGNEVTHCIAAYLCLIIAYVFLEVQFQFIHVSGFVLTTIGATCLFIANAIYRNQNEEGVLLGDVLRIASGICLAFNSIAQEIIVKSIDFVEYLGMIGLIGSVICGFQAITVETNKIVLQTPSHWFSMTSYSVAQFVLNSLSPKVLHDMGAPGLHLALTASEFYAYFIQVISQPEKIYLLYLISYAVTLTGSILFLMKRTVIGTETFFPVKITIMKES